jgi:hypothetical protein
MRVIFLKFFFILSFLSNSAYADYVIAVNHLKNGNKTVLTTILHYNSMTDCKKAVSALLERAGKHTGGSYFISDSNNNKLVRKAYFFHDEAGVSCVVIPSNDYGSE